MSVGNNVSRAASDVVFCGPHLNDVVPRLLFPVFETGAGTRTQPVLCARGNAVGTDSLIPAARYFVGGRMRVLAAFALFRLSRS